jgi:uncharacterized protein Yka (UPF0111/DUF47 family)
MSTEITKFIELKIKLDELQDRYDRYRKLVEEHMIKENITSIEHVVDNQKYKIKKSLLSRESISKKDLPSDIWEKYCKSSSYSTLRVTKTK